MAASLVGQFGQQHDDGVARDAGQFPLHGLLRQAEPDERVLSRFSVSASCCLRNQCSLAVEGSRAGHHDQVARIGFASAERVPPSW